MSSQSWLKLVLAPSLGPATALELLERFGSAAAVTRATRSELIAAGLKGATINALLQPDEALLERSQTWLEQDGRHLISFEDERYPKLLRAAPGAPLAFFLQGDPEKLARQQIAVVGSRSATPAGLEIAAHFSAYLARNGFGIVSGLALGIDSAAHTGALDAGGVTVAVCGTGLDTIYPPQNRQLAQRITASGALISEFPPGVGARRDHFPRRNRLISGLCVGTLVVEAGAKSGALITARYAAEQGREVFAIPGSINSPQSKGCHRLIRDGAKLVERASDILEELNMFNTADIPAKSAAPEDTADVAGINMEHQDLLEIIGWDPVSIDLTVMRSGLTAEELSSMLLILELEGMVKRMPGGSFQRIR
ncbi:MAG: DNA-processing protein DprA [Gammaproteobacteria bacterium]